MPCRSRPPLSFTASALALSLALGAPPALAQVSPAELWEVWQSQGAQQGSVIAADSVTETADGLTLSGFTTTYADDAVTTVGRAETLTLTDRGDGTVEVGLPEVFTISATFAVEGETPATATMEMRHEALEVVASGTPDALRYDYTADLVTISGAELSGGPSGPPPEVELSVTLRDLVSDYALDGREAEAMVFDSSATMSSMAMALSVLPPQGQEGSLKASLTVNDLDMSGSGDLSAVMAMASAPETLPEGLDLQSDIAHGGMRLEIDFEEPTDGFQVTFANAGGGLGVRYTDTELAYDLTGRETEMSLRAVAAPVPFDVSIGSSELRLSLPIAALPDPAPFSARLAYEDVTMGDPIWALFDAGGAIPRDPITVIVDLAGEALVTTSLAQLSTGQMQGPPGELRALTVNELRISAGGAEFTGTGDLTFAPGQMVPQPVGTVDLALSGGTTLAQRLSDAGLIPADQVAMAIGMAGAFTRPGPGPDTLETTITFSEGGGISANGVPLR